MNEILYRGKAKKHPNMPNVDWIFGDHLYLRASDKHYICDGTVWIGTLTPVKYEVDPETVGQYTGLKDKNGKPIFEGDILEAHYDEEHPEDATITVVKWGKANEAYCWCMENSGSYLDILDDFALTYNAIVGNIHDNPELIGGHNESD